MTARVESGLKLCLIRGSYRIFYGVTLMVGKLTNDTIIAIHTGISLLRVCSLSANQDFRTLDMILDVRQRFNLVLRAVTT